MNVDSKECMTKSQLAKQYNVSRSTMSGWLKKLGKIEPFKGYLYLPAQVENIHKRLGDPDSVNDEQ